MARHVAVVFAKEGSLGFPGKNLMPYQGRPLLEHTLDEADAAGIYTDIFVSTNGDAIAACAAERGARVLRRPDALAANESFVAAVNHAVGALPYRPATVTIPQVVQPIREAGVLRRIVDLHGPGIDSVVTVTELDSSLDWMYRMGANGRLARPDGICMQSQPVVARESDLVEIDNSVVSFTYESWVQQESITPWPYLGRTIVGVTQRLPNRNMAVDVHRPEDGEWLEFVSGFLAWRHGRCEHE